MDLQNWQTQMRKGLLDIALMNLLHRGRCHGYELAQTLKTIHPLKIREGNIYPILARLQTDGLVRCEKETSQSGPPRKYYSLTDAGRHTVDQMNLHWDQITQSIRSLRKEHQP